MESAADRLHAGGGVSLRLRSLKKMAIVIMTIGIFLSFLMFYPRSVAETLSGADLIRMARGATLIGIASIGVFSVALTFDVGWVKQVTKGPIGWYALYALWAFASVGLSGDPFLSAAKVFELSVALLVVLLIAHWTRTQEELDRVWTLFMAGLGLLIAGYFTISIALSLPLFTSVGGFPKYSGFGGGPGGANGMSQIASVLALFGISRSLATRQPERKLMYLLLSGLALVVLLVSYSRTSIAIFGFLLLLLLARSRRYVALVLLTGTILAALLSLGPQLALYTLRGQDVETFLTLTGRLNYLWVAGVSVFLASPWIGHGYYYATTYLLPLALVDSYDVTLSNVDNTFLEVAMNLGLVGLGLFLVIWISSSYHVGVVLLRKAHMWRIPMVREAILFIFATFIRSWVNPTIAYHHWNTFTFLMALVIVWRCSTESFGEFAPLKEAPAGNGHETAGVKLPMTSSQLDPDRQPADRRDLFVERHMDGTGL